MDIQSLNQAGKLTTTSVERASSPAEKPVEDGENVHPTVSLGLEDRKEFSKTEVEKAVDGLNKLLENRDTHLSFRLHEKLNEYYVQIVNNGTNEVIREIPSKRLMDVFVEMQQMLGLLVDEKV